MLEDLLDTVALTHQSKKRSAAAAWGRAVDTRGVRPFVCSLSRWAPALRLEAGAEPMDVVGVDEFSGRLCSPQPSRAQGCLPACAPLQRFASRCAPQTPLQPLLLPPPQPQAVGGVCCPARCGFRLSAVRGTAAAEMASHLADCHPRALGRGWGAVCDGALLANIDSFAGTRRPAFHSVGSGGSGL